MQIKKYKNERIPELQKHVLNCKKIFFLVFFVKRDIVSTYSPPDPTYLRNNFYDLGQYFFKSKTLTFEPNLLNRNRGQK